MSRLFSIHETAEVEINEAADFYDLESPGLGSVFIEEIQRTVEGVSQFPEAALLVGGRVRKKPPHQISLLPCVFCSAQRNQTDDCGTPEEASVLLAWPPVSEPDRRLSRSCFCSSRT